LKLRAVSALVGRMTAAREISDKGLPSGPRNANSPCFAFGGFMGSSGLPASRNAARCVSLLPVARRNPLLDPFASGSCAPTDRAHGRAVAAIRARAEPRARPSCQGSARQCGAYGCLGLARRRGATPFALRTGAFGPGPDCGSGRPRRQLVHRRRSHQARRYFSEKMALLSRSSMATP